MNQLAMAFDYAVLDPEDAQFGREQAEGIARDINEAKWRVAQRLIAVQERYARYGSGTFGAWLDAEYPGSRRTAYNWIDVARTFPTLSKFCTNVGVSALYELAATTTPVEVRDEFVARAEAGETIRRKDVKAAVADANAARDPPLLAVVDLETGEVLDPAESRNEEERQARRRAERARAQEIIDVADEDGDLEGDRLRVQLYAGLKALSRLVLLRPEAVAGIADADVRADLGLSFKKVSAWMAEVEGALPRGPRAVPKESPWA